MKKYVWAICWTLVAAMTLAALVRVALSPELLQAPVFVHGLPLNNKGVVLLILPAFSALMLLVWQVSRRSMRGTPAAIQAWHEHWGVWHLMFVLFLAANQTQLLLNSLGMHLPLPQGLGLGRGFLVFIGVALVVLFNRLPKLPPIQSSANPPDPERWPQMARLISWIMVGLGILLVLTGLVGPTPQTAPFLSTISTSFVALALLAIVYHFWRWHWAGKTRGGTG